MITTRASEPTSLQMSATRTEDASESSKVMFPYLAHHPDMEGFGNVHKVTDLSKRYTLQDVQSIMVPLAHCKGDVVITCKMKAAGVSVGSSSWAAYARRRYK